MEKFIPISLNGSEYRFEAAGAVALRSYLQRAERRLQTSPDRVEIMADLEQAIAEKCDQFLGLNKTVVMAAEVETILAEMGPVENPEASGEAGSFADSQNAQAPRGRRKRLYQIREGAILSGVCNGMAAFLDVDVTVVRLLFVILAFATFGWWILAYLVMALIIPFADTPEDRAAAFGLHLNAQELLDQLKRHRESARARREWRRTWKRQRPWPRTGAARRRWQQYTTQEPQAAMASTLPLGTFGHVAAGISLPLFAVVNAALFVGWILVVISAVITRTIFGWPLPPDLSLWGVFFVLCAIYFVVTAPLHAVRHGAHRMWGPYYAPWAAVSGVFWIAFAVLFLWLAYQHIPQVHALLDQLPSFWQRRVSVI